MTAADDALAIRAKGSTQEVVREDKGTMGQVVDALVELIGEKRFSAWFPPSVSFSDPDAKTLKVTLGSSLERDCLRKHFRTELVAACQRAGLGKRRIEFDVQPSIKQSAVQRETSGETVSEPASHDLKSASVDRSRFSGSSLAELIEGECNRAAISLAKELIAGRFVASPVLFWGPSGIGKTSLLRGIKEAVRGRRPRHRIVSLTAEQFTSRFVEAVHTRGLPGFRGKHRGVDLLLLDDVQFLLGKAKTLEEMHYTLDALADEGATVVFASDRSAAELRTVGPELASRLGAGVGVEMRSPDYATARLLVERFAGELELTLEVDAIATIAAGVIGGPRELRGVVNQLQVHAHLLGERIEERHVEQAVEEINRHSTPSVRISDIQSAVCRVFGVEAKIIQSPQRTKAASEPRMLAMWLARKHTQAAWSEIGDYFGRRSHSTVISACRRVEQLMDRHASVRVSNGSCPMNEALRLVEVELRTA